MLGSPNVKETQIPMPFGLSLSGSWRTEMERQQKQVMGIQGSLEAFNARIGKLELNFENAQAGIGNSANSGVQWFSGEVGYLTVTGCLFLFLVAIVGHYKKEIAIHKSTSLILASTTSDEEAREKASQAPPNIQAEVKKTIDAKNEGGVDGK